MPRKLEMNYIIYSFAVIIMEICRKFVPGFSYSFGDKMIASDCYEDAHVCFPFQTTVDSFVNSSPNDSLPILGTEIIEEDKPKRMRSTSIHDMDINMHNTYTFTFHSYYFNFWQWTLCNIPGVRACNLRSFFGDQSVNVVSYELQPAITSATSPVAGGTRNSTGDGKGEAQAETRAGIDSPCPCLPLDERGGEGDGDGRGRVTLTGVSVAPGSHGNGHGYGLNHAPAHAHAYTPQFVRDKRYLFKINMAHRDIVI